MQVATENMNFDRPLLSARFVRRYKRFFADVKLEDGRQLTTHCPNPGSMLSCLGENWPVRISDSGNPERKLRFTLEMTYNGNCWIGVNPMRANGVVAEALREDKVPQLSGYGSLRREVSVGDSRIDIVLGGERCFVEVKSVTLKQRGAFRFPDAVTKRGWKHLERLTELVESGKQAAIFFLIQRCDASRFSPAADIDPQYARLLCQAAEKGVKLLAYRARLTASSIKLGSAVPVALHN